MLALRDLTGRATRSVVIALPESALVTETASRLRQSGWHVYRASDCDGLRRLAWRALPEVVVLPARGFDESGWLTCAKLLRASPRLRVILVGESDELAYAQFVGARALVPMDVSARDLVDRIETTID
jgi:DNA-binding response OmpR family regulator